MNDHLFRHLARAALGVAMLGSATLAVGQPTFGNPSPTAGSSTSQKANQSADQALYKPVEYQNASKKGPMLLLI